MQYFDEWIRWIAGGFAGGILLVWGHITGRIKRLEDTIVENATFDKHVLEESEKFSILFDKHDKIHEEMTSIGKAVARIEGKLSNGMK